MGISEIVNVSITADTARVSERHSKSHERRKARETERQGADRLQPREARFEPLSEPSGPECEQKRRTDQQHPHRRTRGDRRDVLDEPREPQLRAHPDPQERGWPGQYEHPSARGPPRRWSVERLPQLSERGRAFGVQEATDNPHYHAHERGHRREQSCCGD